ncbi:MAG: hypothetical protein O3A00_10890 [Planctomycetota bacterium]|nr:hypothetical protein [Planctomycetota bacterium]
MMMSLGELTVLGALAQKPAANVTGWLFLMTLVGIGLSIVLGKFLAKTLKSKQHATRISVVLTTVVFAIMPFAAQFVLASVEQSMHAAEVEQWKSYQEREGLPASAIQELRKHNSDLEIRR